MEEGRGKSGAIDWYCKISKSQLDGSVSFEHLSSFLEPIKNPLTIYSTCVVWKKGVNLLNWLKKEPSIII